MSLHLIESRNVSRSSAQNRGGRTASLIMHAAFATAVLLLATHSPALAKQKASDEHAIYIAPPPDVERLTSTASAPSSGTSITVPTIVPVNIPFPDINVAPVEIPNIGASVTSDAVGAFSHVSGVGSGTSTGTIDNNAVHNELQVDKPVAILPGARAPKYPDALRAAGVQETVVATFVVDTLGRVEPTSFDVTNSPRVEFSAAVRQAVMNTKFSPAEAAGHTVRQKVVQAFVFSLTK